MGKSHESWNKREVRNKKEKKRKEKEQKKQERKENSTGASDFESMIAYVDEYGNITSTPPEEQNRQKISAEDIIISTPKKTEEEAVKEKSGTVIFYNESKGYGFIRDNNSRESFFFHRNDLSGNVQEGTKVTFQTMKGPKGMNAVQVKTA